MARVPLKIGPTRIAQRYSMASCLTTTLLGILTMVFAENKPPCKVGNVTLAGARNYDARILEYSATKGYRVKDLKYGDEEWLSARLLKTWVLDSRSKVEGKWRIAQPNELKDGYEKRGPATIMLRSVSMVCDDTAPR